MWIVHAQVIACVKRESLGKFGLDPKRSLSLQTEDGASNNKASAKILDSPYKVCAPHDLQRAVLFATGEAGAKSRNPYLKQFVARASKMAVAPHCSTKTSLKLQQSQIARGTPKSRTIVTETANVTRWTGLYRMAHKASRAQLCPIPPTNYPLLTTPSSLPVHTGAQVAKGLGGGADWQ